MNKIVIILIILCLSGCVTQQRCMEKFMNGANIDTIYQPRPVDVFIKGSEPVIKWGGLNDTIISISGTAQAKAWIQHDTIYVQAQQKDSLYYSVPAETPTVIITAKRTFSTLDKIIISLSLILAIILVIFVQRFFHR